MFQERKEYRKNFNAPGQLCIGGETLHFNCYDVSVNGAMIEVDPGNLLTTVQDFEHLIAEDDRAEIFVDELKLAGEVRLVWVRQERNRIMMGLEFQSVVHHANKLWLKRRGYRKTEPFSAELFIDGKWLHVEGINRSVKGLCVRLAGRQDQIKLDLPIKLQIKEFDLAAVGKVVWIELSGESTLIGLQVLSISR